MFFAGLLIVALLLAAPAAAVDHTLDPGDSIQQNITDAADGDTIVLNPGTYTEHDIVVAKNITVRANLSSGGNAANTLIDAQLAGRLFIANGESYSLTIDNLTLQNGRAADGSMGSLGSSGTIGGPGGNGSDGGAIRSDGPVIITSSTISNCQAGNGGIGGNGGNTFSLGPPALGGPGGAGGNGGSGGAVYATGTVTVVSSSLAGCSAGAGGNGGDGGSGIWSGAGISSGQGGYGGTGGSGGSGGAIASTGTVSVTASAITGCQARNGGSGGTGGTGTGGLTTNGAGSGGSGGAGGNGGAVFSTGTITGLSSTITGCQSGDGGTGGTSGNDGIGTPGSTGSDGTGGAAYGSGTIRFCRLLDNNAAGTALYGGIDATDNWWGSDENPSANTGGGATCDPWLVLNITAAPSSITGSQTSLVRVNITKNSAGTDTAGGGIFVPAGIPASFALTSGTGSLTLQAGNITSGANTTKFTPAGAGLSTVSAMVDGQTVSVPVTVVLRPPVANFTAAPRSGTAPLTVRFTDMSKNTPSSWKWTFGDGSSANSTQKNPVHTYAAAGTYNVALNATNADGSNSTIKTGYITVTAAPAPVVSALSPAAGIRGTLITVTNLSGTGFKAGAKVFLNKTGSASLGATNVTVVSAKKITCTIKIPATAVIGPWNVTVKNADGKYGTKANAFLVKTPLPPTVTGITPNTGKRGDLIKVTNLSGTGFVASPKPTVQFLKNSAVITATNVTVVSAGKISCTVKIPAGAATGPWNVRVTNGDNQAGTKNGIFTVNV
jgi:PKD repeat protein